MDSTWWSSEFTIRILEQERAITNRWFCIDKWARRLSAPTGNRGTSTKKERDDMRRSVFLITFAAMLFAMTAVTARAQSCSDAWVTAALKSLGKGAGDTGNNGLCNIHRYNDGHWSNQGELNDRVKQSFACNDPWIGQIYAEAALGYSKPQGSGTSGECSPALYGGSWSSLADLRSKIQNYKHPKPAPAPPPPPPAPPKVQPQTVSFGSGDIVNNDGGLCIDAEGGTARAGVRLIAYSCSGSGNQQVTIDNRLRMGGLCAQPKSRTSGAEIFLHACSGDESLQNFAWATSNNPGGCTAASPCISHNSGYILAAAGSYFGNRPLCLYQYQGRSDQHWKNGKHASLQAGSRVVFPAWVTELRVDGKSGVSKVSNGIISQDGAGIVAAGGGNLVAQGGGNLVAQGGGNLVASGGGN
jgi:Ricin-type beta-trefoil lectin domain